MLYLITNINDKLIEYIKDDPVRPEIPIEFRVGKNRFIASLVEDDKPTSMVCVSLHNFVPTTVEDLNNVVDEPNTAVFYTIWSYKPGSGAQLLREIVKSIQAQQPHIKTFVTLSPKTELAQRFHLKNGAVILRENDLTINYHYLAG